MRVLVLVKADNTTEAGQLPSTEMLAEMNEFNEQLVHAGVMQMGEGLHPSSKGKRVRFSGRTQRCSMAERKLRFGRSSRPRISGTS